MIWHDVIGAWDMGTQHRRIRGHLYSLGLVFLWLWPAGALAADKSLEGIESAPLAAELEQRGWKLLTKFGTEPTRFMLHDDTIQVDAHNSNALIYRPLSEQEKQQSHLRWEWRVDQATTPTNLRDKGFDDRPLAIYVAFRVSKKYEGFWTRLANRIIYAIFGIPVSGKILTYVWGGTDPIGERYPNPYIKRIGEQIILKNSESALNQWQLEQVNLMEDFEQAFGHPAIEPRYLAISADSEDTGERSIGHVRHLQWVTPAENTARNHGN